MEALWSPIKRVPSRDLINKNLLKFKRRAPRGAVPQLSQTVRESPKAETTAAARESARCSSGGNDPADGNNVEDVNNG